MKLACVFGGSGFLGSHVADHLKDAGFKVRIFDNKPSPWLQEEQEFILGDILDPDLVDSATKGADVVYNFAGLADLNVGLDKAIDTINLNILGNAHILEGCRKNAVKRFVYASTVYVHSLQGGFYRCSKQASENYVQEFQHRYGLNYTILRFGSLYGPRADRSNGLLRIVSKALETGVISYEGSSEAIREYIHVEDAARACITALKNEFCNESIVLTGQEPMRVLDMLKMLAEIMHIKGPVEFTESESTGHYVRTPYAFQSKLGRKYTPDLHVDMGQGLLQLIQELKIRGNSNEVR